VTHDDEALWYDYEMEETAKNLFPFWGCALTLVATVVAVYLIF
jgi:hypothetical protein